MKPPHRPAKPGRPKPCPAPRLLSWPGAPHANAVVDALTDMLCHTGTTAYEARPIAWRRWLERADLVAIHWPDEVFWSHPPAWRLTVRIARVWMKLAILRLRGARIVWFVHNLWPHELPPRYARAWTVYAGVLARLTSGWLTLSPSTGEVVARASPALARRPRAFVWHPPYDWTSPVSRAAARATLGYQPVDEIASQA